MQNTRVSYTGAARCLLEKKAAHSWTAPSFVK
ncbi:unknown [Odoribacter sp. CAG:788]|nr:unknown [Odoribacter sp. CAG:788]